MDQSVEKQVLHFRAGSGRPEDVALVVEEPLEIRVNGEPYAVVMRTPGYELELAAGFCLTEGVVDSYSEILSIGFCPDEADDLKNVVQVIVRGGPARAGSVRSAARALPSRSSCGICGVRMLEDLERKLPPLDAGPEVDVSKLVALQYRMLEHQELFKSTWGGTHAVALAKTGGEVVVVREDVGRHNAMDKVIGYALRNGTDCRECVAILSSRISFEMVQKAVRARIPLVAAISTATSLAVELAQKTGCTLVGRLRGQDMLVYSHPYRISGLGGA